LSKTESSALKQEDSEIIKNITGQIEAPVKKTTGYLTYDESQVTSALKDGQKVVLFFAAGWCPSCRSLDATIKENISSIPTDTLIVKVDYDNSTLLRQKYQVTIQHTTVSIDSNRNLISKKVGATNIDEILN
jgi:thiol-disulfide isomerase/thioredoxin